MLIEGRAGRALSSITAPARTLVNHIPTVQPIDRMGNQFNLKLPDMSTYTRTCSIGRYSCMSPAWRCGVYTSTDVPRYICIYHSE